MGSKKRVRTKTVRKKAPKLAIMPRIRGPVPPSMIVKLPMTKVGAVSMIVANQGYYLRNGVALNSIHDPLVTGAPTAADRPRYYTQWAGLYKRYMVRRAKLHVKLHHTKADLLHGGYIYRESITPTEGRAFDPPTLSVENMIERSKTPGRRASFKRLTSVAGGATKWSSSTLNIVPAFHMQGKDAKEDNQALFNTDPATVIVGEITWHFPQATAGGSFWVELWLEQEVILFQPIVVVNS